MQHRTRRDEAPKTPGPCGKLYLPHTPAPCGKFERLASRRSARIVALASILGFALALVTARPAFADPDIEGLAAQIAKSLQTITDAHYQTIAFSRVRQVAGTTMDVDTLIDFTNVMIVRGQRLRVVDRSKLQLILKEQSVQLQDFVSAQKYQELGKILGVDLFLYGTLYRDALVLKAIDVQNSAIAWADSFPVTEVSQQSDQLSALGGATVQSLDKDLARLQKSKIHLVSFWGVDTGNLFPPEAVMDYLSVALTKDAQFKVVDRENIKLIVQEQQLNQQAFVDESSAKKLGELYGVDGFFYGTLSRRQDGAVLASLKLLNVYNGVIEWADLIRMEDPSAAPAKPGQAQGPAAPAGMVYIPAGAFVMGAAGDVGDAAPPHEVQLPAYFMDITEVSAQDYQALVTGRAYRAPVGWQGNQPPAGMADAPVVGVSWDDAQQYCRFVGKRLPQEAEWERAARGYTGQIYPWAGTFSPGFAVTRESGKKRAEPVQSAGRDVSPYGVKNMAGNVREWVSDLFRPYPNANPNNPKFNRERVVRGGSWATDQRPAAGWFRGSSAPNLAWPDVGFRCAKSAGQ
jgi:formylglycine-generating enzyme required for sulfatase activity